MNGSFIRIGLVTRKLLRQNRVLLVLLLLWPCVLSSIVLAVDRGHPAVDDVAAILQQELLYGLVLVGLAASVAFGTELRAGRVRQVLVRAVSRGEYLVALAGAAFLPFVGYVLVWSGNAVVLAGLMHRHLPALVGTVVAELAAGLLVCAVGVLFSVLLPQLFAAAITGLALAALLSAAKYNLGSIALPFAAATGNPEPLITLSLPIAEAVVVTLVLLAIAAAVFAHKDIRQG